MMQLSYVSGGISSARQLGSQFINGVSSLNRGRVIAGNAATTVGSVSKRNVGSSVSSTVRVGKRVDAVPIQTTQQIQKTMPKSYQKAAAKQQAKQAAETPPGAAKPRNPVTGATFEAPKSKNNGKDKAA
jgi:hypothetical protein